MQQSDSDCPESTGPAYGSYRRLAGGRFVFLRTNVEACHECDNGVPIHHYIEPRRHRRTDTDPSHCGLRIGCAGIGSY